MKRKFSKVIPAILVAITFSNAGIVAQNTSPYWSLAGNSNATSTSALGTTNAQNVRIITNNTLRMTINTAGNVGIGTSAPGYKLQVNSGSTTLPAVYASGTFMGLRATGADSGLSGIGGKFGVVGNSTRTDLYNDAGVRGTGYTYGVYGVSTRADISYDAGVRGIGTSRGVEGMGFSYGVVGASQTDHSGDRTGTGVYGVGVTGVEGIGDIDISTGTGRGYGVKGTANNKFRSGVYGINQADSGAGVQGSGYIGVSGNAFAYGIYGKGGAGVYGTTYDSAGMGVYGIGFHGVEGVSGSKVGHGVHGVGNYGVYGQANTSTGYGVYGTGYYALRGASTFIGAYGTSSAAATGYGIYGSASGTSAIGVYGYSSKYIGVYGSTGAASDNYAGYFNGNIFCVNSYLGSDAKLKKNIRKMDNALDIINKLEPKYYQFKNDGNYAKMNLPKGEHFGLLAQDVEKVLPNLVKETYFNAGADDAANENTNGNAAAKTVKNEMIDFKAVNYVELIPLLIKSVQELSAQNEAMKAEIEALKNNRSNVKNSTAFSSAALLQNSPNPVTGTTTISYVLPDNFTKAAIVINDQNGKTLRQVNLDGKGRGSVNINVAALSAGTYNYSLIVDGYINSTKQLVIGN